MEIENVDGCSHMKGKKECRKCAKTFELPTVGLEEKPSSNSLNVVCQIDYSCSRFEHPVSLDNSLVFKTFIETDYINYATSLVEINKGCMERASTSDGVAYLDRSLEDVLIDFRLCLIKRKPDDCACNLHEFRNNYAKIISMYVEIVAKIPEFGSLKLRDKLKQVQFCFTRFICLHTIWNHCNQNSIQKRSGKMFQNFEKMVDQKLFDSLCNFFSTTMILDEEFALMNVILMFTAGANLSPEGQTFIHKCQKVPVAQLAEFLREFSQSESFHIDVLSRVWQLTEWMMMLGNLAETLNHQLVMASVFDWAYLKGNLSFDLHVREY